MTVTLNQWRCYECEPYKLHRLASLFDYRSMLTYAWILPLFLT